MKEYSQVFEPYIKWANQFKFIRFDFSIFDIDHSSTILDVGCGFGDRVRLLRDSGYSNTIGIEPSEYSVEQANDPNITLGEIYDTKLSDDSIDVALVENVFHHIDDYQRALDEIARILAPDGYLCFFEPRNSLLRKLIDFLTFKTPLPDLLKGPWEMRRIVMGQEIATGLYPKWLRSHDKFFELLKNDFEICWYRKNPFFMYAKCRLK